MSAPLAPSEKHLVVVALVVHVLDVGLDLIVAILFFAHLQWGFFLGCAGVLLWAWLVSSFYISFGGGNPQHDDIDDRRSALDRIPQCFLNFVQAQIFAEAYRCIFRNGDSDYFHTLRLMEAILESAPQALLQLYALIIWASTEDAPSGACPLLRLSVMVSFLSVGLGLAMWEQKVQFRASSGYFVGVALTRAFEIASRSITVALFAGLTHPYGFWWVLALDYLVMLVLIARHQSVQFTYGLFVALPLVLVSLEPFVWRREDHAVPKDAYYCVRILEFVAMWIAILSQEDRGGPVQDSSVWIGCQVVGLLSAMGLYAMLPCVWLAARRHELSRDVTDWADDEATAGLQDGGTSDSSEGSGDARRYAPDLPEE